MKKEEITTPATALLMGIGSFIYCVDVAVAIAYFVMSKKQKNNVESM